jgi:hypothetical protein
MLEISAMDSLYDYVLAKSNISHSKRLAQVTQIELEILKDSEKWMQIDGECIPLGKSKLCIGLAGQISVIKGPNELVGANPIGKFVKRNLVVLINARSGGRMGAELLRFLQDFVSKGSIYGENVSIIDINEFIGMKAEKLEKLRNALFRDDEKHDNTYERTERYVIAGGGDGTAKRALEILSQLELSSKDFPKIGLLPLGTANELCRVTGWRIPIDPGNFDFQSIIRTIFTSEVFLLDKWIVSVTHPVDPSKCKSLRMLCFASIGQDAEITHHFQEQRDRDPNSTGTVIKNKYWYFHYGMKAALNPSDPTHKVLNLEVDEKPVSIPEDFRTVQILNISTMADGINFW